MVMLHTPTNVPPNPLTNGSNRTTRTKRGKGPPAARRYPPSRKALARHDAWWTGMPRDERAFLQELLRSDEPDKKPDR
jgi:hypothetical protein